MIILLFISIITNNINLLYIVIGLIIYIIILLLLNKYKIIKSRGEKESITNIIIYSTILMIILYLVGNLLRDTLENLRYIFDVSEIIIGIVLGIATSIPEFVTFIESQKFHKNSNEELGVIEASNNLLVSNTLNLFIIQSISIIIINFLE